ncbi:hypothetical protein FOA52_009224 [Chlamydomonas sp. UWO 241]|nr:hypothetical protein FOA52_009224 [Chlamydomonas sp. UWO 241]
MSTSAKSLYRSPDDALLWSRALGGYVRATNAGKPALKALERWYVTELPQAIAARAPAHIVKAELVKLVEWKLTRGKWRPGLLNYAKEQVEADVVGCSTAAFKLLQGVGPGDAAPIKAALAELTELKGVGPATASALLAAVCPHAPFMGDEALEAATGKREYKPASYMALTDALQGVATRLNAATSATGGVCLPDADAAEAAGAPAGCAWSAVIVERALWAASVVGVPVAGDEAAVAPAPAASRGGAGGKAGRGKVEGVQEGEETKGGEVDELPPKAKRRRV